MMYPGTTQRTIRSVVAANCLEPPMTSLSDIPLQTIDGRNQTFGDYAGKAMLIVNVASQCGFTPQYQGLEALYRRYRHKGFVVLGFPLRSVRPAGAGRRILDPEFLLQGICRHLPAFRKDPGQRRWC